LYTCKLLAGGQSNLFDIKFKIEVQLELKPHKKQSAMPIPIIEINDKDDFAVA